MHSLAMATWTLLSPKEKNQIPSPKSWAGLLIFTSGNFPSISAPPHSPRENQDTFDTDLTQGNKYLTSGGYPWTVIPVEQRGEYMTALESASVDQDIKPFSEFIAWLVEAGLNGKPIAKLKKIETSRKCTL